MKVKFIPQNVELEIKPGQSVLSLAQEHGLHIQSVCKGIPSCAECRVNVREGEHNVIPPSTTEISLIGSSYFVDGRRLSCQLRCFGDITIDLNEQIEKQDRAAKRPRGKVVRQASESRAVLGSLVLEDEDTPMIPPTPKNFGEMSADDFADDLEALPGSLPGSPVTANDESAIPEEIEDEDGLVTVDFGDVSDDDANDESSESDRPAHSVQAREGKSRNPRRGRRNRRGGRNRRGRDRDRPKTGGTN